MLEMISPVRAALLSIECVIVVVCAIVLFLHFYLFPNRCWGAMQPTPPCRLRPSVSALGCANRARDSDRGYEVVVSCLSFPSISFFELEPTSSVLIGRESLDRTEPRSCRFWRHWRDGIPHIRSQTIPRQSPHMAM